MKKLLWILPIVLLFGFVNAQTDLAYVSLDYCDASENLLSLQVDPGIETGICYTLANGTNRELTVKLSFVDGTFTNDQRQNKACLSDNDTENFGKYVTDYDQIITLQAGEAVKKEAMLMYPKGTDGLYYGCVVYSIVEEKDPNAPTGNFSILMRRAKFIDLIVGDPANAQERGIILEEFTDEEGINLSRNPRIRLYKDSADGKYIMQLKVKNISRVQQDVIIEGIANNIIGTKFAFGEERKILKGEKLLITKKIEKIPLYNLRIKLNITNTPMTFGDIKPMMGQLKEKTCIGIWNAITFITLGAIFLLALIIFLLIKDIKKRKVIIKVIHDKAPVQKPTAKKVIAKKIIAKKAPAKKKTVVKKAVAKKTTKKK